VSVATRRGDEILSLQTLGSRGGPTRLLVASSKGDPAGRVVVCGPEGSGTPLGIVATDSDIYASYRDDDDVVITRVVPWQRVPMSGSFQIRARRRSREERACMLLLP
jgi:hypothetical protein